MKLCDLPVGHEAVLDVFGESPVHVQLLCMGIHPGSRVTVVRRLPRRGNLYLSVGSRAIVLRNSEAEMINVTDTYKKA